MLPELWCKIIHYLDCSLILNLRLTSKYFNNLINENDLYMKRKFRGFPRQSGRCKEYGYHDIANIDDLVRGDIISLAASLVSNFRIFDGCRIKRIVDNVLPKNFTIINYKVPIRYWENYTFDGVTWFNHEKVKQQCINNLVLDKESKRIYTTFRYDDQFYTLEFIGIYSSDITEEFVIITTHIFEMNSILKLYIGGRYRGKDISNDNLLFIRKSDYSHDGSLCE